MPRPAVFGIYATSVPAPSSSVTLNPADKAPSITLSGGNLTATGSLATWKSVRANINKTTGKFYCEATCVGGFGGNVLVGVCNSTFNIDSANAVIGIDNNGIGAGANGNILVNGNIAGTTTSWNGPADTGCMAVDVGARLFWARKVGFNWNNDPSANPATGVGGIAFPPLIASGAVFPGVSVFGTSVGITANFGLTAFSGTPPTGYVVWA